MKNEANVNDILIISGRTFQVGDNICAQITAIEDMNGVMKATITMVAQTVDTPIIPTKIQAEVDKIKKNVAEIIYAPVKAEEIKIGSIAKSNYPVKAIFNKDYGTYTVKIAKDKDGNFVIIPANAKIFTAIAIVTNSVTFQGVKELKIVKNSVHFCLAEATVTEKIESKIVVDAKQATTILQKKFGSKKAS